MKEIKLSWLPCGTRFWYKDVEYVKHSRYRVSYKSEDKRLQYKNFNKHLLVQVNESEVKWS
jgi:hypothetical protein